MGMGWTWLVMLVMLTLHSCSAAPTSKRDDKAVEKLEQLKSKLQDLKEELSDLGAVLKGENDHEKRDKINKPNEDLDEDIKDLVNKLSPEDIELLKQYSNKAHYFINAYRENPGGLEPDLPSEQLPEEPPKTKPVLPAKPGTKPAPPQSKPAPKPEKPQTEPVKRSQEDRELEEYISHLSPEDQRMLKGMESKLHYLKTALHSPGGTENEVEKPETVKRTEAAGSEGEFSKDLQPEDVEILKNLKTRLNSLRTALKNQAQNGGEEGESDINFAKEAERRFLNDVEFAREHGVKITDLLKSLKARKVDQLKQEERELEGLAH